ncbi:RloB domain-containing protein [Paenibacillus alba]|uniref:RloB domain-containing protein n=1 Tax=Paenibacillus alba TaxID=1197127 RepID=A0ABU6G280_9BACL|nr:RloB domain-containing protein [Paenibacillus alba]MEC0228274.1 RloB domain-containing protein [Paenibacillus alba]
MPSRKKNIQYYFSVEGETESWYLGRLRELINNEPAATHTVSFDCKIEKDPIKRTKQLNVLNETVVNHWFDRESNEEPHITEFIKTLDALKKSSTLKNKIKYKLGYSNFTFELWMVLHKADCNASLAHRRLYLTPINRAFDENFTELDQYKSEANFKRVLRKITLVNVVRAVERAKVIMKRNEEATLTLHDHRGFKYYKDNPSLTVHESVEKILKDCGLI